MLLALPHGLFIPAGATYQIDAGEKKTVAIQTSDQNGAYAAVPLNADLIKVLKTGTNLNIGMESVTRSPVTIPVSLNGFTVAIDKLDAIRSILSTATTSAQRAFPLGGSTSAILRERTCFTKVSR